MIVGSFRYFLPECLFYSLTGEIYWLYDEKNCLLPFQWLTDFPSEAVGYPLRFLESVAEWLSTVWPKCRNWLKSVFLYSAQNVVMYCVRRVWHFLLLIFMSLCCSCVFMGAWHSDSVSKSLIGDRIGCMKGIAFPRPEQRLWASLPAFSLWYFASKTLT